MNILVLGLSHRNAPIEIREKLAFVAEAIPLALNKFRDIKLELLNDEKNLNKQFLLILLLNIINVYYL